MPSVNDPNNDKSRLESRIEDLQHLPRQDRQLLQYWLSNFRDSNADSTTLAHLSHLFTLHEHLSVPFSEATKFDWTGVVTNLSNERGWTSGTKRNYQKSIRSFLDELEDYYEKEIHHGRLYPNLDTLVDKALVEKGERDRRTNFYVLTRRGKREIEARREWENQYVDPDGFPS